MFKRNKGIAAGILAVAAMVLSSATYATCVTTGKVGTIWSYNQDYAYVGIAPDSTYGTAYVNYYFVRNYHTVWDALMAASASGGTVTVSGDAASCPTSGTIRYGGNGTYVFHSKTQ